MKKILLIALFPIVAFATDAPQTSSDVDESGMMSCVKDHVLECVNDKCIPAATAGAKDTETKACVDQCKEGVEDTCKKLEQKKTE